ncbi:ribosomal RNA small subunit methyltransferase G [Peptoclostridium acidaminophilum DSM 3953]|uniref:Ribosomal RNA small subunit methyltransferase G n=1 Tax=Peptoclostridium acidaminophilum DSM 3953 TaxID=1286171 RepID=W8U9F8_PEPAC|nr:16S rRNA (guanine(527)-N(7))-methyltransferase RsmG [Peptoclostridium acidaminophilum]AHM57501.1 ribosomal RNA small subunit methyltransferase G [Peptoclostridium acidaminophilum DSM 3953]
MDNGEYLKKGIEEIGLSADDRLVEKFETYKRLLLEWNEKMNLTAITQEREIYIKHFVDSLSCICSGVIKSDSRIIDVGTGAGFPGLPLKIYDESLKLTLLDSLRKRINFLENVCGEIGLSGVEFLHSRAEDAGNDKRYREKFDVAVSRAVAPLNVLLEYCTPFIRKGGYFVCQKGPAADEELVQAAKSMKELGVALEEKLIIKLPFTDISHYVLVFRKVSNTPSKYPRKAGLPSKKPIA